MSGKFIFSTRGSNSGMVKALYIAAIAVVIVGIFMWSNSALSYDPGSHASNSDDASSAIIIFFLVTLLKLIPFGFGAYAVIYAIKLSGIHVDLYDDHIEGTAFIKKAITHSFYIKKEQISHISIEGSRIICIHAGGTTYKVESGRASDFMYYYNSQFNK